MFIRYNKTSRQILHVSMALFTVPASPEEADVEAAPMLFDVDPSFYRLLPDFSGVERDDTLIHPNKQYREMVRNIGQRTIEDMLLDYVASRPDAPQEIKDEAARRKSARPQATPTR